MILLKKYRVLFGLLFLNLFSGCIKEDDIVVDSYSVSMLSATLEIKSYYSDSVNVNLHLFIEAAPEAPIDSIVVLAKFVAGEIIIPDIQNQTMAVVRAPFEPGYLKVSFPTQGTDPRNYGIVAYSQGAFYKTKAVPLRTLFRKSNLSEVAYYNFDNNADDHSGSYHLLSGGTHSFVPGDNPIDPSFSFEGGYLYHPSLDAAVGGSGGRTFAFRCKYDGASDVVLFSYGDVSNNFSARTMIANEAVELRINGGLYTFGSGALTANAWHIVVISMPAGGNINKIRVLIDGQPFSNSGGAVSTSVGEGFWIGADPQGATPANGLVMDDFHVWNYYVPVILLDLMMANE